MEKSNINVFEIKSIRKDFGYKISAADVHNQFLYVGDEKGTLYSYPFKSSQSQVISKNVNQQSKKISSSKIDKIICYSAISTIIVLSDQKLFAVDSALKKSEQLSAKIHDFAINQFVKKEGQLYSIVAISRKKQGFIFYYNPETKKLQENSNKFNLNDIPMCVGLSGKNIICSYKKDYEIINIDKSFAVKKGPMSSKNPFLKVTGVDQILFFQDDIGIFMDSNFHPKQKDNIAVPKAVISITICGLYCLILYEGLLQIYSLFDPKKFTLIQQLPVNNIKGTTSDRPFIYSKEDLYYLYQIPYETQIKALLQRCRVEEAKAVLIQNVGQNEAKIEQLKMNAVWPLLKRMQFQKAKDIIQSINFDIREIVLLFPEMVSVQIDSLKSKPDKTMVTMISQYVNEKVNRGKDQQNDLKKKSKIFLKEVLQIKRQSYIQKSNMGKMKIQFSPSKSSLIKPKLQAATGQQLLQIIDFSLIKWYIEMKMFRQLEQFFLSNPIIYCKKLFEQFQNIIKNNQKIFQFPNLIPRFYTAFDKIQQAFEAWRRVSQSQKDDTVRIACQQAVKLLTQFQKGDQIYKKLKWILQKKPQIGMSFFNMVPISFIQPDQMIKNFEQDKQEKYLQLYLQIIVIEKNTQIEAYHTKLLMIYIDNLFKIHPKQNKQQGKGAEFQQKLSKMRKLLQNSNSKYASQPILRKIEKCQWLMQDQIFLFSRQKRHQEALRKYITKNMSKQAEKYCLANKDKTLTTYFKMLLSMYSSYRKSENSSALLLKKDLMSFLKRYSSNPQLDPIDVLQKIPEDWMLNDIEGVGGIYQFLQSSITHTLHQKRTTDTSKYLSQMDLLNVEYNLIQAKRAYLRFTYQKKCVICQTPIADKFFVVYPNANVCHQACVKKEKNTICPVTKQDFEKTFKY